MKTIILLFLLSSFVLIVSAQTRYTTQDAHIQFFSEAPFENIEATSNQVRGGLDIETGQILFVIPIKSFEFKKNLMRKHFNEQYLESDKYPTAKFEGSFSSSINVNSKEKQAIQFNGTMTIHGVSRELQDVVSITLQNNQIIAHSKFILITKDFKIKIPRIFIKNIATEIEVEINANLKQVKP